MKFLKKHWLKIVIIIFFIIKCWIVSIQPIMVKGYSHDDALFINSAINLVEGNWLGVYNDTILSKGITGILFLSIGYKLNLSYLFMEQLLYFIACISFVKMLKHITKNKIILLISYVILLFNPISFSDAVSFVYRDGIYISFILLLISLSFEVFFRYKNKLRNLILYIFLLGIDLAAIYLCREETIWILPYLILAFIITILFIIFDKSCKDKIKRISCILLIPLSIVSIYTLIISSINYRYYGRFITNDFTSKDFKDAYGALTRIKPTNYIKRVPLNGEERKKLYKLSPAFKELEVYLEGKSELVYRHEINQNGNTYIDYKEGFLYWAVREAVYKKGYYTTAKSAKLYYERLANEINSLCDSKKLECHPKRSSLVAPLQKESIPELIKYIPKTFDTQLKYKNVYVRIPDSNKKVNVSYYEKITFNKAFYNSNDLNSNRMGIMQFILLIYQKINYILFVISLFFYVFNMIVFFLPKIHFKNYKEILLLNGLLCIYLIRIFVVGFVAATEYESAINKCQYLASIYPIQSIFSILNIIFGVKFLIKLKDKNIWRKYEKKI